MNAGDKFKVVEVAENFEEDYSVGDIFEFHRYVDDKEDIIIATNGMEFYDWEVELVEPPKDYDEDAEYAAKDADVSTWVKEEEIDEYNEIVISLSQAIAQKAEQMHAGNGIFFNGEPEGEGLAFAKEEAPENDDWDDMPAVGAEIIYDAYNPDVVKAPAHYVNSGIEPIQYMADKLPAYDDGHTAFCVGNVIKYVSRAPHKGNLLQDLKKARQYLDFAIEHEEKKQN